MGSSYTCPWLWYAHRILDDHWSRVEDTNIKSNYNDAGSSGIGIMEAEVEAIPAMRNKKTHRLMTLRLNSSTYSCINNTIAQVAFDLHASSNHREFCMFQVIHKLYQECLQMYPQTTHGYVNFPSLSFNDKGIKVA